MGRYHAEKLARLKKLAGVVDADPARAGALTDKLGGAAFTDYREIFGKADAAVIAVPTDRHHAIARDCLEHGLHLLIEKPIATTLAEADELIALAEKKRVVLQTGHVERYNKAFRALAERLQRPVFVEAERLAAFKQRGAEVDVVLDLMIHDLDVVLSLVDAKPTSVSAVGIEVLTETFDIANARVEFDSGAIANLTASRVSTAAQRKFRVFEQNQYVSIDFGEGEVQRVLSGGVRLEGEQPLKVERFRLDKGDALRAETEAFVRAVVDDTPCRVSGRDGLAALELAEAIIADIERRAIRGPRDRAP
jgi:predicted dehydrogenase